MKKRKQSVHDLGSTTTSKAMKPKKNRHAVKTIKQEKALNSRKETH